jgi:hypothetical protein
MAQLKIVAEAVSTVAATTAVQLDITGSPFAAGYGRNAVLVIIPSAVGNQVGDVQGSVDGTTWTQLKAYTAGNGLMASVVLPNYIRVNNTGGTTGQTNFYLFD